MQRELARQRLRDCKSLEIAEQKKVTLSFPSSDSTPAFSLREHPVSRNHSVFCKAKNCEAPWGEYFLPPASNTTAGIFYMPREWYAAGVKKMPPRRMGFGLPGAPAQKKKKQKENAIKETRKRGLFEKSPLLTPSKTF